MDDHIGEATFLLDVHIVEFFDDVAFVDAGSVVFLVQVRIVHDVDGLMSLHEIDELERERAIAFEHFLQIRHRAEFVLVK